MTTQNPNPQNEGGGGQPNATNNEAKYTKADVDKAVESAKAAWSEEKERLKTGRTKAQEGLASSQARVAELEKALESGSDSAITKELEKYKADLADARGKLTGYRTEVISAKVASELSADPAVVNTLIIGLRSQGVLDKEPEDPTEAAKAFTEKLREKHGALFEQKPTQEPAKKRERKQGRVPDNTDGRQTAEDAFAKRQQAQRNAGAGSVRF